MMPASPRVEFGVVVDVLRRPAFAAVAVGALLGALFYSYLLGPPEGVGFDRAGYAASEHPFSYEPLADLGL